MAEIHMQQAIAASMLPNAGNPTLEDEMTEHDAVGSHDNCQNLWLLITQQTVKCWWESFTSFSTQSLI